MGARFVSVDRETPMLLPPDLRDWGPEDDLGPFVIEAVERLRLESVRINHRGTGDKQFPPHMMLALLICSYPNGLFSSRKTERAIDHDVAMPDKLRTEEGKALDGRRNHTVEPVFGIIKAALGFHGFALRGKENVSVEWTLACLVYNLKLLHRMGGNATNGAGDPESRAAGRHSFRISPVGGWLGRIIPTISRRLHRLAVEPTAKLVLTPTVS
jgi:hypothetical protein